MKIGFIDHYDSFSFNLVDWLSTSSEFSVMVEHTYFDDIEKVTVLLDRGYPLVFSPGPKNPDEIPQSMSLMRDCLGRVPILGVCLGFQMLGVIAGLKLGRASEPRHGISREIFWTSEESADFGLSSHPRAGVSEAAVYNSLGFRVSEAASALASPWSIVATDRFDNVQGLLWAPKGTTAPALGLQFHPESFLSSGVNEVRSWWLRTAAASHNSKV